MTKKTHICLLLVEDNPADVELIREILCQLKAPVFLHIVSDGEEAMSWLTENGPLKCDIFDVVNNKERCVTDCCRRPDIILLDLNMPKKNGFEVIKEIRSSKKISTIPIVVLTTSTNYADVEKSYAYGANCYVTKPVDFEHFSKIISTMLDFWIRVCELPMGKSTRL